jgi:hypothetical protein
MATSAAVPPRPAFRVPRPERASASPASSPVAADLSGVRRAPTKSEPRLSLHSIDLEEEAIEAANVTSEPHQRATLVHPLGEEDPVDIAMDALRTVKCLRAVEAASVCLAVLVRAVGCRAAMAHLWDPKEKSFVVVYALGPNAGVLLNAHHDAKDPLLAESFAKRTPRVINHEVRPTLPRHSALGGAWSVLVAPVMDGWVPLGAMELVDPLDGSCFDDRHIAAARYTTERLVALLRRADASIGKLIPAPEE